MKAYVNGRIVEEDLARLSVLDAGFQHAVGLFETMGVYNGRVFRLREHLGRMARSAGELGLAGDLDVGGLEAAVGEVVAANGLSRARLRLAVTAGAVSLLRGGGGEGPERSVVAVVSEPTVYDPGYFERGVMAVVGPPAANPFDPVAGHKTLAYWSRLLTLRQAAGVGAGEVIWLNISNHLASGAVSNVFLVRREKLLTPIARGEEVAGAMAAPVLPGTTRAVVMEVAGSVGLGVERKMLTVEDLLDADEVFLTNSSWLVLPVTGVEKKQIGDGAVGSVTRRVRGALLDLIERETGAV